MKYTSNSKVPDGFYWNAKLWKLFVISGKIGTLPDDGNYLKIPAILAIILAPLMGGLFVLFLPFVGMALLADYTAKRIYNFAKTKKNAHKTLPVVRS